MNGLFNRQIMVGFGRFRAGYWCLTSGFVVCESRFNCFKSLLVVCDYLNLNTSKEGIILELNLGIRAHDIQNQTTIEGLVEEIAGKGLTGVQLALGKSFEDINSSLGSLSPGFAQHIGGKFAEKMFKFLYWVAIFI